jgi:hypothetical protein
MVDEARFGRIYPIEFLEFLFLNDEYWTVGVA